MSPDRPIVPQGYGEENYQTFAPSGGFAAAAVDYARLLAALNGEPYTPLGRSTVDSLLTGALAGGGGHGFDGFTPVDAENDRFVGSKGGQLNVGQTGMHFESHGFCYIILWNGLHYGTSLRDFDPALNLTWWPTFEAVLSPAQAEAWSSTDLFPEFDMPSLPKTEDGWRRCKKCQSLHRPKDGTAGACPAGGAHHPGMGRFPTYGLMVNSKMDYGEKGWRRCVNCRCTFFAGKQPGTCAAGGVHDMGTSSMYSMLLDTAYKEHEQKWRRCKGCHTMFFAQGGSGMCADGGTHDGAGSGLYSIATAE